MGVGDGTVIGHTKIVDNGSPAERWNLVLVSEGYRNTEMAQFATDAQNFVNVLLATPPFSDWILFRQLSSAMNVYRVDVSSTDSGADDPAACGGTGATAATYFDARFCNGDIRRLLLVDNANVINVANTEVPQWHMILVLVNTPIYGGGGGDVATFSMAPSANEIGLHEMGHTAFGLADEYEYWAGCGAEADHNNHPAGEPSEPNVTLDSNRETIKWRTLIDAATPMPTTSNADCTMCDPQPNPVAETTVGAFEGAHYYHCGSFRPQFNCRMRALGFDFCAVCQRRIRETLSPFLPPIVWPHLFEELDIFDIPNRFWWVADPVPIDLIRFLTMERRGRGPQEKLGVDVLSQLLGQIEKMDKGQLRTLLLQVKSSIARLETAARIVESQLEKGRG